MNIRFGVRGRLFLAFFGISVFAVFAAAVAIYSFIAAGDALERITQHRVPATLASQRLSRQAERITAAAPVFLSISTPEDHKRMSERIEGDLEHLRTLLKTLHNHDVDPASYQLISNLVGLLRANLLTLDTMIINKIVLVEHRVELLRKLRFADLSSRRMLAPGLLLMDAKLAELNTLQNQPDTSTQTKRHDLDKLATLIAGLIPLQKAQGEVAAIHDILTKAAAADSLADLGILDVPLRRSLEALAQLATEFDPGRRRILQPRLARFALFVDGKDSIVETRARELRHLSLMQTLLDQNLNISHRLNQAVDRLVAASSRDIQLANAQALSVQRTSTIVMIAVVMLSLACSGLIVWLYVGRNLIARLTGLSDSMLAIAAGNLEAPIPTGDHDEITGMAEALAVFRETAQEVRKTNIKEISEARRQLTDAIESISEGFSLYDAEDRLLVCNSHYRDSFYPGIANLVAPGSSFESFVRGAAERGLVKIENDDKESWIDARLARHNEPCGPVIQPQVDGRWFQIDERKTENGGTVAVYTDISELKRRESELAKKSNALEQLSTQLSKYLSPQIYDSIFKGKQEVKIASSRKKLTIFFSDIVDFTGTATRLESEELTVLLNHYFNEMSKIAMLYGATVDKYIGDAIMIFFGDPETMGEKQDALACVKMAIAMQERLRELQYQWFDHGLEHPLQVRMGINTGYCTVGNIGSEDRLDYTIIGPEVNLAARLQSHAKPGEIIIAHETFSLVRDTIAAEVEEAVTVKGFAHPVRCYRIAGTLDDLMQDGRVIRHQENGVRIYLDLQKQEKVKVISIVEDILKQLKN